MGLLSQSHNIFRTVNDIHKASPIAVHLAMIFGVGLYALFGALVMQKLETKAVYRLKRVVSNQTETLESANSSLPSSVKTSSNNATIRFFSAKRQKPKRKVTLFVKSRKCVMRALKKFIEFNYDAKILNRMIVRMIEHCYYVTIRNKRSLNETTLMSASESAEHAIKTTEYVEPWTFSDAILFTFTVITTIGYGNIAPQSFGGRLFCIIYGFIGIPFTLLAIADLGKFFSEIIEIWEQRCRRAVKRIKRKWQSTYNCGDKAQSMTSLNFITKDMAKLERKDVEKQKLSHNGQQAKEKSDEDNEELEPLSHTLPLMGIFIVYSLLGALLLSCYEPEMTFFKAIYFNFITLTSIGLGDVIPKSKGFLWLTLIYIAVGLALTTIAIDLAADYLKRLHYYGRKIENVGNVSIWFGGKSLTVKQLVKNLGDQFNLPTSMMKNLNLDKFVDDAIKVEEGEIETLRLPPIKPSDVRMDSPVTFADDDEEPWFPMKTPTPTPSPEPLRDPTPAHQESLPEPESQPDQLLIQEPEVEEIEIEDLPQQSELKSSEFTPEDLNAMKRRNYSQEAWRRYQEYQRQWRRFRQTQKEYPFSGGRRRSSVMSNQKVEPKYPSQQYDAIAENPASMQHIDDFVEDADDKGPTDE